MEDFYNNIGYGGLSVSKLTSKLRDEFTRVVKPNEAAAKQPEKAVRPDRKAEDRSQSVILDGLEGCDVKFAKCCNPLPGDPIIGFITKGFGVSIHKYDCPNAVAGLRKPEDKDRWIVASWRRSPTASITAISRPCCISTPSIRPKSSPTSPSALPI